MVGDWLTEDLIALKREAIESIYHHRMTVYDIRDQYNPETGFDEPVEIPIIENEPCRVSSQVADPTDAYPKGYIKKVNLICRPELDIPIGCRIEVDFYNGKHDQYRQVSPARHYSDHQTLIMRKWREEQYKYA